VAFWRLFPHSAFKRKPTGKTTRHKKTTGGKQGKYRRRPRAIFTILSV